MKRLLLTITIAALFVLHQDFWFWKTTEPLLFGFVPPALWYHAIYCIAAAALMGALVKFAWPEHLESQRGDGPHEPGGGERH